MSIYDGTVSATAVGNILIGAVDYINGSGAEPSGFVVTKHELEQVARYWFHQQLDNDFFCFLYQQSGSLEWRLSVYSEDRLNAIAGVLGANRMREICNEVFEKFKKTVDPTAWRTFTNGSREEASELFRQLETELNDFETHAFEVCIWFPERVREVIYFLCSRPLGKPSRSGISLDSVCCRYATREEADDLAQRLRLLRIDGIEVEVLNRFP